MCAAEELASDLYSVPDHLTLAMLADGRHFVNRALEAVEDVPRTRSFDYNGLVVIVTADFAVRHKIPFSSLSPLGAFSNRSCNRQVWRFYLRCESVHYGRYLMKIIW
jgi:hypothetical protein